MRKRIIALMLGAWMAVSAAGPAAANVIVETVPEPVTGSIGGEWAVIALARNEEQVPDGYYDSYLDSVEQRLVDGDGVLDGRKYTEYSRTALGLAALGENPQDFRGWNVIEPLKDLDRVNMQGSNGPIWALIAVDSLDYEGMEDTQAGLLETVLGLQNEDGGYGLIGGDASDADLTAMALTALSAHQTEDGVPEATEDGLGFLEEVTSAGFSTCESCAQAMLAYASLDCREQAETCREELEKFAKDGGYCHTADEAEMNEMSTEQAFYSIAAYNRMIEGKNRLFDMRDANE